MIAGFGAGLQETPASFLAAFRPWQETSLLSHKLIRGKVGPLVDGIKPGIPPGLIGLVDLLDDFFVGLEGRGPFGLLSWVRIGEDVEGGLEVCLTEAVVRIEVGDGDG